MTEGGKKKEEWHFFQSCGADKPSYLGHALVWVISMWKELYWLVVSGVKEHKGKKNKGRQQLGPGSASTELSVGKSWTSPEASLEVSGWFV